MNYCILNGVKSTTIQGLLIQSLPPISKPKQRTSIEEIDGRDGDIVTKLGYSAYDRPMTIGLFGEYDVDEVIQYFDSEGTVIFSNEPDKFYNYEIIEQIDFERLLRFKTATVVFHVQPFKWSAVDDVFSVTKEKMSLRIWSKALDGVLVSVENDVVSVRGQATRNTEFYVPINPMELDAKTYTLKYNTSGTGRDACSMRIIEENPTDDESFGNTELELDDNVTLTKTLPLPMTFNYIYFSIEKDVALNFTMSIQMYDDTLSSFKVFNRGNHFSRPTLTIYGQGNITLSINGVQLFAISLGYAQYITINGLTMEAYKGNTSMNRNVSGNYDNLRLKVGSNTISWTGNVTQINVENVSRWT